MTSKGSKSNIYVMSSVTSYIISAVLHITMIGLFVLSEKNWFYRAPRLNDAAMIIDLVNAPEVSAKSSAPHNLVKGDESNGMISGPDDVQSIEGDTKLISKDSKVYATPPSDPNISKTEYMDVVTETPVQAETAEKSAEQEETVTQEELQPMSPVQTEVVQEMDMGQTQQINQPGLEKIPTPMPTAHVVFHKTTEQTNKPQERPAVSTMAKPVLKSLTFNPAAPIPQLRKDNKKYEQVLQAVKQYRQEGMTKKASISETQNSAKESISDVDARLAEHLMQHVYNRLVQCWDIPVSTEEANVKVQLEAKLDHNGYITEIFIAHKKYGDPIYDALEASAIRAIKACSPLIGLPQDKYYLWNHMNLVFDPRKVRGK